MKILKNLLVDAFLAFSKTYNLSTVSNAIYSINPIIKILVNDTTGKKPKI